MLKRLQDAIDDGDAIRAVIRGFARQQRRLAKIGYTAPSVQGQAQAIAAAHALAGVEPETITYVEAHGTGTDLGDPIEMAALSAGVPRAATPQDRISARSARSRPTSAISTRPPASRA